MERDGDVVLQVDAVGPLLHEPKTLLLLLETVLVLANEVCKQLAFIRGEVWGIQVNREWGIGRRGLGSGWGVRAGVMMDAYLGDRDLIAPTLKLNLDIRRPAGVHWLQCAKAKTGVQRDCFITKVDYRERGWGVRSKDNRSAGKKGSRERALT